jgi:hypothetical protein
LTRLHHLDIFQNVQVSGKLTNEDKLHLDVLLSAKKDWEVKAGFSVADQEAAFGFRMLTRNKLGFLET